MTSHKHSFQCFDAVVDKPSLTAGHNFALPNRSSFTSTHLEQLKNHRCSLCSESQQAKPVTSGVSGNQSASWYQPQSPSHQHTPRRPIRPEGDPADGVTHHHHNHHHQYHTRRYCKRIVLVKNSNPSIQKTILLHRKPVHSLDVFMDDISELMQCLIRKLYTLDGRKVDSVQSLLQGPGILVCVGREPFRPHLLDSFQKNFEDKLPKLILKPQSSTYNEDQGYKKNVNFGQKFKKRVPPGPFPKAKENMLDDDIEKRVLVNKDGSLSMEMKVRFHLLNDETLHCSTEIKKSSCTFNASFPGQDNVYYPHCGYGESCSEAESLSASEADDVYITKFYQKHLEEPHCQHCCTHCQEYDIWKNPALSEQETLRHIGSSSLHASSHKIKYKKESIDSVHTTSSEEYTEQVVEKATCIQQTVEEGDMGDNTVQYCTVSRCCSRSEVCSLSAKAKKAGYTDENYEKNESTHAFTEEDKRPVPSKNLKQDQLSVQITQVSVEDERLLFVETNSSDILASLMEDEDKEETVFSPSNSRASQSNKENDKQSRNAVVSPYSFTPNKPLESPKQALSTRTSSTTSCCSVKSKSSRKFVVTETQENVDQDKNNTPSSTPHRCQHKEPTDVAIGNGTSEEKSEAINQSEDVLDEKYVLDIETGKRALKSVSDLSKKCDDISDDTVECFQANEKGRSSVMSTPPNPCADLIISNNYVATEQEFVLKDPIVGYASEEENIHTTSHAMSNDSDMSECSIAKNKTEEPADVTQEEKVASALPPKLNVSAKSSWSRLSEVVCKKRKKAELQKGERGQSVMSNSKATAISKQSTVSEPLANGREDQIEEVMTCALSKVSGSSQISDLEASELREMEDQIEDRSSSIMSVKSSISEVTSVKLVKVQSAESLTSALSTKTNISVQSITKMSEGTPVDMDNRLLVERAESAMSAKSDVSVRSKTSYILDISPQDSDVIEEEREERAPSAKSNKSNTSLRSNTSKISTVAPEEADDVEEETLKRPLSVMSSKSAASVRSTKSRKRDTEDDNTAEITKQLHERYITSVMLSKPRDSELSKKSKTSEATLDKSGDFEDNSEEQAPSTMSAKSHTPTKSNKSEMLEIGVGEKEERPVSAMSLKSNVSNKLGKCKISEAQQEYDHPEVRPASIMSSTSAKSKRSVVSDAPCENEEEEFKQTGRTSQNALSVRSQRSRKSKASEDPRQDTGNEENIEGAPSPMSCKSILSDSSNLAPDGVVNTGSTEDLLKETESAYEETKDDRAVSAMSSKSQMPSLSNKSKDLTHEKAPTSTSAKSNVSRESTNSEMDQSKDEGEEKHERASILASPNSNMSTRSKKTESLGVVSPARVENQNAERTLSAMSGKSSTSKASKKNTVLNCFKEPKKANEEELVERSPSTVSAKSNTSVRSKGSDTQSNEPMEKICLSTISPKSNPSAKDEKSNFSIILNNSTNVDAVKSEETWDIKIDERAPSDMSAKSSVLSRSVKSNISALAGGQTNTESSDERSDSVLSGLKISMTEISNNAGNEERASSALSKKSNTSSVHHTSERVLSSASASVSIGIVEEYDVVNAEEDNSVSLASVNSTPRLNSKTDVCCKDSSKTIENENQQCMETPGDRAKSSLTTGTIVSDKSKKSECTHKNSFQPITDNEVANNKYAKRNSKKSSSHSLSIRSAHSDFGSSKTKDRNSPAAIDKPKRLSNTLLHLNINEQNNNANAKYSVGKQSKSNLPSDRYSKKDKEEISRPHSADVPITSVSTDNSLLRQKYKEPVLSLGVSNHQSSSSNQNASKFNTTKDLNVCDRTCNGSLIATDCSRNVNDNKSEKNSNSICRHSSSSLAQKVDNNPSELVPSILPISSPMEVVNEWLKKIPLDSALYDVGYEFHDSCEEELLKLSGKVMQYESGDGSEGDADAAVLRPQNMQVGDEEIENNESKVSDMTETAKDLTVVENIQPGPFSDVPSSVQLMRILLSPKPDRCNSLPEVSPVYGTKLSTSARGFLESLVNLQLLDFDPNDVNGKAEKYNDLMNMLQSLWLCEPSDKVTITQKSKFNNQQSNDEEFNVKSSSRVDNNRSLQDFGKSSVNDSTVAQKSQTNTEAVGAEMLTKVQEIDKTEKAFKGIETKSDSATPDIASRVRWTPENELEKNIQDSHVLSVVSDLTIRNEYSSRDPPDTASMSTKSSGNDSNDNQKLTDHEEDEEDTSSESPSSEEMVQLTEKVSQAPDPVWVLNLLSKIEKKFMTHYITAMAEFKVRWNLNDNEQLDVMICELRDEVHKRIQASINNELRKIQGHAGRPRPPKETMSRESSILTEQRRRRLKVNLNQSIDPAAKIDDDNTAILMTDFADQKNDDEYCPCDTCMKKKTLSKPVLAMEVSNSAPMMIDFDLRKILHSKRKAPSNSKENVKETENEEQHIDIGNLAENVLLESFKKEKKQELYKANLELQAKSIEQKQNESDTSNDKRLGKEYSQAVVGSKPQGVRKGSSSSSLEEDASDTQLNKSEQLNNHRPMKEGNNTSKALEKESPIAGGELRDHVELRNGAEILEVANKDPPAEEAQSGPADMGTEVKITEDEEEICGKLAEGKWSVEDEPVREEHTTEAGTAKENMVIDAGTGGEPEVTEGESTEGKGTEVETSDAETGDETAEDETLDKKESMRERRHEDNETAEGEISESEPEEGGETETPWKYMPAKPDISVEAESSKGEAAEKEIATTATEKPEIKSEIIENEKDAGHELNGITEDGADEEDDIAEAEKRESTNNEERDANESAEEDIAIKKINKESGEDDLFDEGKISKPTEDGDICEHESAEGAYSMNDESAKGETDNDELDAEGKTNKAETAADKPADNETAESRENFYDDTSDKTEINEVKTAEDGETDNVTTEDGETIGVKMADVGEMGETKSAEDDDYESAEDAESSKPQTAEDTSDDETSEYGETPKAKITEDGVISDDAIADDEGADDAVTGKAEIAEDTDTDDDEISEVEETPYNETVDSGITTRAKTTEYEETHDDGTSEDGEAAGTVVTDDAEIAEAAEKNGNNDIDERGDEPGRAKTEVEGEIVDNEIIEDEETHKTKALKQFVGDGMNVENVQTTEGEATANGKATNERANGETAEDTEMDTSQSEEDGETADNEADNGEIADDGTAEDGETPNDNTADGGTAEDEKPPESDMEEVDETNEAETADDGEQEDDGRADGQIGDDDVHSGTENEENEETAETKTEEDGETVDNGTTEDGDTADEIKSEDEELSENEIVQNGEIAKETIEKYGQTDDSESLENGETTGGVNGETDKNNTAEAVINTHNIKTKQNSDMMSINQDTGTFESNRYIVNTHSVNSGESDEGGDEAECETDPVERDERAHKEPTKWPLNKDDQADERIIASFDSTLKMYPGSEDGADADGEDSETEVHNKDGSIENEEDD